MAGVVLGTRGLWSRRYVQGRNIACCCVTAATRQYQVPLHRYFSSGAAGVAEYDVAVIGGGPGGYVAAIKAAQEGLKTVCVEKRGSLGGTCLNVGCIPSKALLNSTHHYHDSKTTFSKLGVEITGEISMNMEAMQANKNKIVKGLTGGIEGLFKANKVVYEKAHGKLISPTEIELQSAENGEVKKIAAKNVIIASGSESAPLPGGAVQIDEVDILSSTGALALTEVPKKMVVIGGGVIGLELGSVYRRLGSEITVVEFLDRIVPAADAETAKGLQKILQNDGLQFMLKYKVVGVERSASGPGLVVKIEPAEGGEVQSIECDKVLVAVGRRPYTENLGLENVGVKTDRFGRIPVDEKTLKVEGMENVYAIGDVIRGAMLAHKAEEEGFFAAERIAGKTDGHVNYDAIPSVVYTHPEMAGVGASEEQLKAAGVAYKKSVFPFAANSRARANDDFDGFVKVLTADGGDAPNKLLGAWILGPGAGELISIFGVGMEYGASGEDLGRVCYAHPSLAEAVKEACLGSFTKTIHFPPKK